MSLYYLTFAPVVDFWFPGLQNYNARRAGGMERFCLLSIYKKCIYLMTLTRPHPTTWIVEMLVHGAYDYRIEISSHNSFILQVFPSVEHLCRGRPRCNNVRYQVIVCQSCLAYSTDEGFIPCIVSSLMGKTCHLISLAEVCFSVNNDF